jgi:integrase
MEGEPRGPAAAAGKLKKFEHHESLPWERCPAFTASLMDRDGDGSRPLLLTILCALRTSETLDVTWREFDFAPKTWTIPARRMKTEEMHWVPLADAAMALLLSTPEAAP